MRAGDIFKFAHMSVFVTSISVGIFGLSVFAGQAVHAQIVDFEDGPGGDNEEITGNIRNETSDNFIPTKKPRLFKPDREVFGIPPSSRVTPPTTSSISEAILDSSEFCGTIKDKRYRPDCVAERLIAVARSMPQTGEYAQAREILMEAGLEIRALVQANKEPDAPVGRATGRLGNSQVRTRPLVPVKAQSLRQVNRQAANILQEAETKLLRAAEASDRRLIAYAQIAQAVGSNKTLLRSA